MFSRVARGATLGLLRRCKVLLTCGAICAWPALAQVQLSSSDGRIAVEIDGKPFTTFYFGPETTKPYLHPLRAADGTIVTRRYPMERIDGESHDHPHHRGLWFAHGDVNGFDFWSNEPSQQPASQKGRIELNRIVAIEAGATGPGAAAKGNSQGRIRAIFDWKSAGGKLLLTEDRVMVFHSGSQNRVMDFDLTLRAGSEPVTFGDTKEGTFALRVATPLEEPHPEAKGVPRTGRIVSAEGRVGELRNWGKRSAWVDYSGRVDGKSLGIAIFDHPGNPGHPTYWHVRSYGLFAANIFGEHDFYADDSRDAHITLAPGEALRFRYRVVIHPGDTQQAGIARLYEEYTQSGNNAAGARR